MLKTRVAVAVLLAAFAIAPAGAAKKKPSKSGKPAKTKTTQAKAAPVTKPVAAAVADPVSALDKRFNTLTTQFLTALWRIDPEAAIYAGKYDGAANLPAPSAEHRARQLAFADEWLAKFRKVDVNKLSIANRTDMALLINELESDRWYLNTFRDFEWDPSAYSVAGPIDLILSTEYAAKPQRLRTLLKRVAQVPAYYAAAQASIKNPTREHTRLAIRQAPGNISVLEDVEKEVAASILTPAEKELFAHHLQAAKAAVNGFVTFLTTLDQQQAASGTARSFRIGKELYEPKFTLDIQSGSTAEQTYRKALAARDELLARMDSTSDELWPKVMGNAAKPADRFQKIGMVIDKLSAKHVAREDFFPEIRRQIPLLQDWVNQKGLLDLDPKKPLVVRETPVYQRGVAGASIDAPGPYRPQDRTYYNVTPFDDATPEQAESTLREYNHWILQILNIHEAIPGHYAQLVYANKSPSLVKALFGNGAMIEGWAVYAERMMMESGFGDSTPEMWLMYSKWNLRVVTNTLLDYNVHVLGMNEAEAMDLLTRQAFQTQQEAKEKWNRVQVSSVQLTSYFSGYSEIMELREQRKQALGARFNLKQFHEQFLGYGSAPVRMIKDLMQ
jgi:uncharacterized protein (DUF885 family)